jgi:hypothetical protein
MIDDHHGRTREAQLLVRSLDGILGTHTRCVMITLPQGDLPKDSRILRTAAQHNAVNVGVYASALSGGSICHGDAVSLT